MPSLHVQRIARLLGELVQAVLLDVEARLDLLSMTPANAIEKALERRILNAAKKPMSTGLEVWKPSAYHWYAKVPQRQCVAVDFRVFTYGRGATWVKSGGRDLYCLVALGKVHASQSRRGAIVAGIDPWLERLVSTARVERLTPVWGGKAIPLEHATLDWRSFCQVRVFASTPLRIRVPRTASSRVEATGAVSDRGVRRKGKAARARATGSRATRVSGPSAARVEASVDLLIDLIRVVVKVWCEQLEDPYGSGRRFALMELD
jgi:hypothetical protein